MTLEEFLEKRLKEEGAENTALTLAGNMNTANLSLGMSLAFLEVKRFLANQEQEEARADGESSASKEVEG